MDIIPSNRGSRLGGLLGRRGRGAGDDDPPPDDPVIDLTDTLDPSAEPEPEPEREPVSHPAWDPAPVPEQVHLPVPQPQPQPQPHPERRRADRGHDPERRTARGRHEMPHGSRLSTSVVEPVPDVEQAAPPLTRAAARAARQPSRAGRNLPAAVGVGLVLGALVIGSLFIRKEAFVVLATLAIVVGVWELTEALGSRRIAVPIVPVAVGAIGMLVAAFAAGGQALAVCFTLTCLGVVAWRVAEGHVGAVADVAGGLFVAAYVPLLGGFTMLLLAPHDGPWRELAFILLVVGSDTGGYAVGVLAGRHPMAPSVSPKKSWEGFAGSVAACVLLGIGTVVLFLHGSWWAGALTGAATVLAATLGDLGESLVKRDLGIKDMSSLLPGHGGVLDRIDSLLFAAPVVWLMLHALVPVSSR